MFTPKKSLQITTRTPEAPDFKFELLPLHSQLLRQSLLVSFPPLIDMLKFSGYPYLIRGQKLRYGGVSAEALTRPSRDINTTLWLRGSSPLDFAGDAQASDAGPINDKSETEVFDDARTGMPPGIPGGAMCVQRFDDSLNSAIHTTYRISLRSSSMREPRDPLLKVLTFKINSSDRRHE